MSDNYFAPMYGGLMIPLKKRTGSIVSQSGSALFALNQAGQEISSPLDGETSPTYMDTSPVNTTVPLTYDHRLKTPSNRLNPGTAVPTFQFKRFHSDAGSLSTDASPTAREQEMDSEMMDTSDSRGVVLVSPPATTDFLNRVSRNGTSQTKQQRIAPRIFSTVPFSTASSRGSFVASALAKRAVRRQSIELSDDDEDFVGSNAIVGRGGDDDYIPLLKLGDEGRAKLKSALSEQVRVDPEVKAKIDDIGKIRLASMQQLLRMAKIAGIWDYAILLAQEHEVNKAIRRTG